MRTAYAKIIVMALSLLALSLQGCEVSMSDDSSYNEYNPGLKSREPCLPLTSQSDPQIEPIDGEGTFTYTMNLGDSSKDVCLIFTNSNTSDTESSRVVSSQQISLSKADYFETSSFQEKHGFAGESLLEQVRKRGIGLKGTPEITKFNSNPPRFTAGGIRPRDSKAIRTPKSVGATEALYDTEGNIINATLKSIVSDSGVTLHIWVSDKSLSGATCEKVHCLSPDMIQQFGEKFLKLGVGNDIYEWGVDIFGVPWGAHVYGNLIGAGAASQIDILFYDIDNDDTIEGGTLGSFYSKDNYIRVDTDDILKSSNERLMFYMDSVMSATPCHPEYGECSPSDVWAIEDYWPSIIVSTLAHEFQHMIHFYQKQIKNGVYRTEPWINEMASMVAEDLLADKMEVDGSRGVAYNDGGVGNPNNGQGRLPLYNYNNYATVAGDFQGELDEYLIDYSMSYAFGAYLARNYGGSGGGAALFREIVQNQYRDYQAIANVLDGVTFAEALKNWGIAVLLSNRTDAAAGQQYNTGGYFTSGGYNLGSINLYNYCVDAPDVCGPRGLYLEDLNTLGKHNKISNTFVKLGSGLTGTIDLQITLPNGVEATAVIADSE